MNRQQKGFTLIEIAIVLVIIGLLLGGVLKGQELITGARVRNFVQQQDGVKAAYFGFLDRYRALPGDYAQAATSISNITTGGTGCGAAAGSGNGDGDAQIEAAGSENILVWEHLSKAGFINGTYTCASTASAATSPQNPYGQPLNLIYDADYAAAGTTSRHNLKTGDRVPSDILAEVDRKVDDGNAIQGSFRGSGANASNVCWTAAGAWTGGAPSPCAGATLF